MKYYLTIKWKTHNNLDESQVIILSEGYLTQNVIYCVIPFIQYSKRQNSRDETRAVVTRGWEWGNQCVCVREFLEGDGKVLSPDCEASLHEFIHI